MSAVIAPSRRRLTVRAMTEDHRDLFDLARCAGVATSYVDAWGNTRQIDEQTLRAVTAALTSTPATQPALVATPGRWHPALFGRVQLEDGRVIDDLAGAVPADAEGYHVLTDAAGERRLLLAAPEQLRQPRRGFGWAVQLYAARTRHSWGIGDFADLAQIGRAARRQGAGFVLISPVHAIAPTPHPQPSPYSPASREWLNVLHVSVDDAPGAGRVALGRLRKAARDLNKRRVIDRDQVWSLKREALAQIWAARTAVMTEELAAFRREHGRSLELFATWSAITEIRGGTWRDWPAELRHPDSPAVEAFAAKHADVVTFHAWLQLVADQQFAAACDAGVDVVADIAVGFDAGGADGWRWQDQLAFDFEVGCPPDRHNPEGQGWGLPCLIPQGLEATDFAPFAAMVRSALRHAAALRIDHVMQLWRLWWAPLAGGPRAGTYVHYPVDALLAILRIEASRAGAWLVGEDMGTVADGVRDVMSSIGMLGYRVAGRTDPQENPVGSLGAAATHDHPTIVGILTGQDALDAGAAGKQVDLAAAREQQQALAVLAGVDLEAPVDEAAMAAAVLARYAQVAASPSRVVAITLDDAALVAERPNMPGTVTTWPNWKLALPEPVEKVLAGEVAQTLAAQMRRTRQR